MRVIRTAGLSLLALVALLSVSSGAAFAQASNGGVAPAPVQAELQAKTLRDIYAVATALEAFAIDNRHYPGPTDGFIAVETVRKDLQPNYVRDLPATDAWGGTLLYWSDGKTYKVVSNGADRKANAAYDDPKAGTATLNFDGDIIFENGHLRRPADATWK
jgi:hypothetical protein